MTQDTRVWKDALSYILGGLIVVLVLVNALTHFLGADNSQLVGKKAPSFELQKLEGHQKIGPQGFAGDVVVLDFWATWCRPCRQQMPILKKLVDQPKPSFKLLSVNTDADSNRRRTKVKRFLEKYNADFTTLLGGTGIMQRYGINSLPGLVVISPDGRVSYVGIGLHPKDELERLISEAST